MFQSGDKIQKVDRSHWCLCYSLCWQDLQATVKQNWWRRSCLSPPSPSWKYSLWRRTSLSSYRRHVGWGSLCEKMDFLRVFSEYLHQRKLTVALRRRAVMSVNATTKEITHDEFPPDRGSHRCCETFRLILGAVISADKVHSTQAPWPPAGTTLPTPIQSLIVSFASML